jgi:hypothetical protein
LERIAAAALHRPAMTTAWNQLQAVRQRRNGRGQVLDSADRR